MSETWLTPEEVRELTARQRWSAQCRALAGMGIPFTPNAVGRPLVERDRIISATAKKAKRNPKPNWDAIRGPAKAA